MPAINLFGSHEEEQQASLTIFMAVEFVKL